MRWCEGIDSTSIVSAADRDHKVDFAGFVEFVPKLQRAGMPVDHHGNGRAQPVTVTQPLLNTGITPVQMIDHIPNGVPLYLKRPLSACKLAQ